MAAKRPCCPSMLQCRRTDDTKYIFFGSCADDPFNLIHPIARVQSLGAAAGARYPLAVVVESVGVGTRHQPHGARSCELALRAVGAAQ